MLQVLPTAMKAKLGLKIQLFVHNFMVINSKQCLGELHQCYFLDLKSKLIKRVISLLQHNPIKGCPVSSARVCMNAGVCMYLCEYVHVCAYIMQVYIAEPV